MEQYYKNDKSMIVILRCLYLYGPMSRKDIAEKVRLSNSALTQITGVMLKEGMLVEVGEVLGENRPGRRKILIDINPTYKYVIGINIEQELTYLAICNLSGKALVYESVNTRLEISPDEYISSLCDKIDTLLEETGIGKDQILGAGVAIIGPVDTTKGISLKAYGIWQVPVLLLDLFKNHFSFPVAIDSNTNAMATAGIVYGREHNYRNALYVKWMPGIGAAVVLDGKVFNGYNHRAAELGHVVGDYPPRPCRCGNNGCLETMLAGFEIIRFVKSNFSEEGTPKLYKKLNGNADNITQKNFAQWILTEEPFIDEDVKNRLHKFSVAISNMANTFGVEKILFYGQGFCELNELFEFVRDHILAINLNFKKSDLIRINFDDRYNFLGPIAVAVSKFYLEDN
jgi:transcriptional regulator of PTS gene